MDFNGDESVDEEAAALVHQNPFRNGTYHDELHSESKLVSVTAPLLLLVLEQKTTDQISVTSVRRALSAYINNAALQMHAQGGTWRDSALTTI